MEHYEKIKVFREYLMSEEISINRLTKKQDATTIVEI